MVYVRNQLTEYSKPPKQNSSKHRMSHSMTQLLLHTFAHLTGPSFKLNAKLLPNKIFLGLM